MDTLLLLFLIRAPVLSYLTIVSSVFGPSDCDIF